MCLFKTTFLNGYEVPGWVSRINTIRAATIVIIEKKKLVYI